MQSNDWRDLPGYELMYSVSRFGEIYSKHSKKVIKGHKNKSGYVMVCLAADGKKVNKGAHQVVALAWHGPRPPGYHVDHIDGRRDNNVANNLRYLTPAENTRATVERGAHAFGERNGMTKLTAAQVAEIREAKRTRGRYWGHDEFAKKFGVSQGQVFRAANGWTFKHLPNSLTGHAGLDHIDISRTLAHIEQIIIDLADDRPHRLGVANDAVQGLRAILALLPVKEPKE